MAVPGLLLLLTSFQIKRQRGSVSITKINTAYNELVTAHKEISTAYNVKNHRKNKAPRIMNYRAISTARNDKITTYSEIDTANK